MESFSLDTPLLNLPGYDSQWTVRNAVEGVQIFGGIGSGKTSGSGRMLALKFLSAGFGGLVLTAKPDEKELWQKYCQIAGRTDDLIIVEPQGEHRFNFLDYEISKSKPGIPPTENIVQVLKTVIRASEEKSSGKSDDPFWETALDMLLFNVIDLCNLAYGSVSVQQMYNIAQSLPSPEKKVAQQKTAFDIAMEKARQKVSPQIDRWENQLPTERLEEIKRNDFLYNEAASNDIPDARSMMLIDQFFMNTFYNLSDKTRSTIEFSFTGFLFGLMRDPVYSLFCSGDSTFSPEDCERGKIIILNLPVKVYHKIGRDCQIMFKYIWQRAMEKRDLNASDRPVFLWADEAQNFLHEHDPDYQATARSSRIATVYISQNIPNYHANMGGSKSDFKVKSFLGTLATKIFHANADIETNRYASDLIGDGFFEETSSSETASGQFSVSRSKAIKMDKIVRPEEFTFLKTGGDANRGKVEGYMHLQGNVLPKGLSHIKLVFDQEFKPKTA